MKEPILQDTFEKVSGDVADYVDMKLSSVKLATVEGLSKVFGDSLRLLILILFCSLALMAFFVAAIISLGIFMGSMVWSSLIVGGVCIIIGLVLYASRSLFVNPMVKMFSDMFFSKPDNSKSNE